MFLRTTRNLFCKSHVWWITTRCFSFRGKIGLQNALLMIGGFGVAKNFSTYATKGADYDVLPEIKELISKSCRRFESARTWQFYSKTWEMRPEHQSLRIFRSRLYRSRRLQVKIIHSAAYCNAIFPILSLQKCSTILVWCSGCVDLSWQHQGDFCEQSNQIQTLPAPTRNPAVLGPLFFKVRRFFERSLASKKRGTCQRYEFSRT